MPTNFPKGDDGHRTSPLTGLLDAPNFAKDRDDFVRMFGSDEAVKQFLGSPEAVTRALRDYVWSIGVNGGTAPSPNTPPTSRARLRPRACFGSAPASGAAGGR